jgi:hypothetical protein
MLTMSNASGDAENWIGSPISYWEIYTIASATSLPSFFQHAMAEMTEMTEMRTMCIMIHSI